MGKYYKTYTRNKKESNISQPLRYSFLKSIFVEGLSVKNVPIDISRPPSNGKCTTPPLKSLHAWPNELTYFSFSLKIWPTKFPQNNVAGSSSAPANHRQVSPLPKKTPRIVPPSPRLAVTSTLVPETQSRSLARLVGATTISGLSIQRSDFL